MMMPHNLCIMQGIPTLPELKLCYYELMIKYYQHYHNYLEICRCYKAIYESEGVQADPAVWVPVRTSQACQHGKIMAEAILVLPLCSRISLNLCSRFNKSFILVLAIAQQRRVIACILSYASRWLTAGLGSPGACSQLLRASTMFQLVN